MSSRAGRAMVGQQRAPAGRGGPVRAATGRSAAALGNRATLRLLGRPTTPLVQRKGCGCGGTCGDCGADEPVVQRSVAGAGAGSGAVAGAVRDGVGTAGRPLDGSVRAELEPRFGFDLGAVRVHASARAAASARAVGALAYTIGHDIVFAAGQHAPHTRAGRRLLAHELAHVIQQSTGATGVIATAPNGVAPANGVHERQADAAADAAVAGHRVPRLAPVTRAVQRQAAPYIKQVRVSLAPPQHAELTWQGSPPEEATGSDMFTVSTGKGYGDPGDPPGTCTRDCCADADTQCAPPWNKPTTVGSCCTFFGSTFWTGKPRVEHNGWKWWTPIEPYYSIRGIALHQHDEVTGEPIGHGCVRMADENAKRIFDYSNGKSTNVTIGGRAAPVACDEDRRCGAPAEGSGAGRDRPGSDARKVVAVAPIPGLEGRMT